MTIKDKKLLLKDGNYFLVKMILRCIPLALTTTVMEAEALYELLKKYHQPKDWPRIEKQLIKMMQTLRYEIAHSQLISKNNAKKFEMLGRYLTSLPHETRLQYTPSRPMTEKKLLNHCEELLSDRSILQPDIKSIVSMIHLYNSTYEIISALRKDMVHLNKTVPKGKKINIEKFLSITPNFYNRFKIADTRVIRNAFAHDDFIYEEEQKRFIINFQYYKNGKEMKYNGYKLKLEKLGFIFFEYTMLLFIMKIQFFLTFALYAFGNVFEISDDDNPVNS